MQESILGSIYRYADSANMIDVTTGSKRILLRVAQMENEYGE